MSVLLFCLGLILAYAGMLGLCLAMDRHWKQLASAFKPGWQRLCRPLGWLLLTLSLLVAWQVWPPAMAPVGWLGMPSLGGISLLFLLPYQPRLALWLPLVAAPVLLALGVMG